MVVIIKMKGLPWEATARDIRTFYRGLDIREEDIHLAPSQEGKASGFAFACFQEDEDARKAMHRNGNFVGKRYIELILSSQSEMEKILSEGVRRRRDHDSMEEKELDERLKVETEVARKSNGLSETSRVSREIPRRPRSRSPIRKSIPDDRSKSRRDQIGSSSSHVNGRKHIEIKRDSSRTTNGGVNGLSVSRVELDRQSRDKGPSRTDRSLRRDSDRNELGRSESRVARERETRGHRPETTSGARRGAGTESGGVRHSAWRDSRGKSTEEDTAISRSTWVSMKGLPYNVTESEVREFFKGLHVLGVQFMTNSSGPFAGRHNGEAFVEFKSIGDCIHGSNRNRQFIGKRYVGVRRCTVETVVKALHGGSKDSERYQDIGLSGGTHPQDNTLLPWRTFDGESRNLTSPEPGIAINSTGMNSVGNLPDLHSTSSMAVESQLTPVNQLAAGANISVNDIRAGCVIGIRNLPSTVSAEEILDFFYGFPIIPNSIRIHYLAPGRSSGDAMVTLPTGGEALSAIEQLNHKPVGKRKVQLFLV